MSLEAIRAAAAQLAPWGARFAEAGGRRLYVVGGAVRSLLSGGSLQPHDELDMTTDAPPAVTKEIVADWVDGHWTTGERFGTIGCRHQGRTVEITTHRAEVYTDDSRRPLVAYGTDLTVDLARRDFTIGAMAFEVPPRAADAATVGLIDPFGGREDLARGLLRTPRPAETALSEDPLRMLRAGRFTATLQMTPAVDLEAAMSSLKERLVIVSAERCARELELLLTAAVPTAGVDLLARTGVLAELGCEPTAARVTAPGGLLESTEPELAPRLAALLWGAEDIAGALRRLRFPRAVARRAETIATAAWELTTAGGQDGDAFVRRWALGAGIAAPSAARLALAASGDHSTAALVQRWRRLAATEDLSGAAPLSGSAVMELLDIGPGPAVGAALGHLEELRIVGGPLSAAAARGRLAEWWEGGACAEYCRGL